MNETENGTDLRAVYDRLTRLEERGLSRDERMTRMEHTLERVVTQLDQMAGDLRDAKTGLRIGLWITSTVVPTIAAGIGWFAHLLWPGK
jgi:hypothetical protein